MDKKFIIKIENQQVEVTEEVYLAYYSGERKQRYFEDDLKTNRVILDKNNQVVHYIPAREESLEYLMDDKNMDFPDNAPSTEAQAFRNIDREVIRRAIKELKPAQQDLVYALFYEQLTEREYAVKTGQSQSAINQRKKTVLKKLKNLLQKTLSNI